MELDMERVSTQRELLLKGIASRLEGEFGEMFTRDTLDHYVRDSHEQMAATWRIVNHIPAFVDRFTRQRLRALAKNRGIIEGHAPEVLFVCARNDAASQMAAGLLNRHAAGRAIAHSAGTAPAAQLLTRAVEAMSEIGVDLSDEFTKPVTPEIEQASDVVVTLDAHDDIPIVDETRYVAWRMPDPHDDGIDGYRRLRDALDDRVRALLDEIAPAPVRSRKAFDDELTRVEADVLDMGRAAAQILRDASRALAAMDVPLAERVIDADDAVDTAYLGTERTIVELIARQQPVASDLRRLVPLLQTGLHLERIADGAVDIARVVERTAGPAPQPAIVTQLVTMGAKLVTTLELALRALQQRSRDLCLEVVTLDHDVDHLYEDVFDQLVSLVGNDETRAWSLSMDQIARLIERAGGHAVDIAEAAWFQITGELREFDGDR